MTTYNNRPRIKQYRDKLAYDHTITGSPRIRAEWNWNHTNELSVPAKNAVWMKLFDQGNTTLVTNKSLFDAVFATPVVKEWEFGTPSFYDQTTYPDTSYESGGSIITLSEFYGIEIFMSFYVDVPGNWQFHGDCDDTYEVYVDETLTDLKNYTPRSLTTQPGASTLVETDTITMTVGWHQMRIRLQNSLDEASLILGFKKPGDTRLYIFDGSNSYLPGGTGVIQNPVPIAFTEDAATQEWKQYASYFPLSSVLETYRPMSGIRYNILSSEPDSSVTSPGAPSWGVSEELPNASRIMNPGSYITSHNDVYERALEEPPMGQPEHTRGAWTDATAYYVHDIVEWNGADYVCYADHTSADRLDYGAFRLISTKPHRYYNLQVTDQKYKYYISEKKSSATAVSGKYPIAGVGFTVHYDRPVSTNKISVTFNLGAAPGEMLITYKDENGDWNEIFGAGDSAQINPYTGQFVLWINSSGEWTEHESHEADDSILLQELKVQVLSLSRPLHRAEIIEVSARKELDITDRVVSFDIDRTMEEVEFFRLIGDISSNSGSIQISNWDSAFDVNGDADQKLDQLRNRQTKFTFDLVYDLEGTGYAPRYYPVRMATMNSADWSRDGEFDYSINMFDSAKLLMNIDAQEFFERPGVLHALIAQILDGAGFDKYQFDRYDYDAILNSTTLDYFAPGPEDTVWDCMKKIAHATLAAIFFDEYDVLQVITKEEITRKRAMMTDDANPVPVKLPKDSDPTQLRNIPVVDHIFRGEEDEPPVTVIDQDGHVHTDMHVDVNALPNIINLSKSYDVEANRVRIVYRNRAIKTGGAANDPQPLTDIVWRSEEDIVVRATRLIHPLPATSYYSVPDNYSMFFFISPGQEAELFPYSGRANINGEIVEWEGKEYYWRELITSVDDVHYDSVRASYNAYANATVAKGETPLPVYEWQNGAHRKYRFKYEILYNEGEKKKRIEKAGDATYAVHNGFTGKMRLKVDTKTQKIVGRAAGDPSGYQVSHPTGYRDGNWKPVRIDLGIHGVYDGYWPGEQQSSFYQIQNNGKATSIEINRPTNRNDDWFKTQALIRREPVQTGEVLQKFGFRFMFKDSATMGEISLMFNMGTALPGNFGSQTVSTSNSTTFNQWYQLSLLETQGIVRNVAHEIAAWVQSPDPLYRTQDNAIRGGASRMYTRNYHDPWAERMKGYRWEFKRNQWYDVQVDLTRGRGYAPNHDMHFFVWINGVAAGGFSAAGPPNAHLFAPATNWWGLGFRAASKVEIENAWSWTEFAPVEQEDEKARYDLTRNQYASSYLEEGLLYPNHYSGDIYRGGATMDGTFFFDDFGSMVHEIRDFDVELEKAPAEGFSTFLSNENVRIIDMKTSPNRIKFSLANVSNTDQIASGEQNIGQGNMVNHQFFVYGYVLTEGEEEFIEVENEEQIRDRGEVKLEIDAEWVNNKYQAQDLANWVIDHFSEPMDVLEIEMFADCSLKIGDKARVFYRSAEIDPDNVYIVSRLIYSYDQSGLKAQVTLKRVRNNATNGIVSSDSTWEGSFVPTITTTDIEIVKSSDNSTLLLSTGSGPITYAVTSGVLPAGVTLQSNGLLYGYPLVPGGTSYSFTVTATNSEGSDTQAYSGQVKEPPTITTTSINTLIQGSSFTQTLAATGNTPITWTVATGYELPDGLSLSSGGVLSGTPTGVDASYTFMVVATNDAGDQYADTQLYTVSVRYPPVITQTELNDMNHFGIFYDEIARTGSYPIVFSVTDGELPLGVFLFKPLGVLFGIPLEAGTYDFTITATSPYGSDSQQYTGIIA